MMSDSYHFERPEHFTAGTVGPKGERTFFLQFGNAGELVALKLEKGQVHALAEYLDQLLDDIDPVAEDDIPLALDLIDPVEAAWVVGSIGVAFEDDNQQFVLVVDEFIDTEGQAQPDVDDAAIARIGLSLGQAQAFVARARGLVASGRPPCDYCGRPIDEDDGWCPCHN